MLWWCRLISARRRTGARLVQAALEEFGRIDLLVNNAGMGPRTRMDILETTEESYDEVMNVNLKGPFFLSQLVARDDAGAAGSRAGRD